MGTRIQAGPVEKERLNVPVFSLKVRVVISLCGNFLRSLLGFATAIIIARGLSPAGYGDLMFLLGSFTALRSLMDLGSSSAFYTFIAQHNRHRRFFLLYYGWLLTQFALTILIVAILSPTQLFEKIWVGHDLPIVLLAALASFTQQQFWPTVGQIADSVRRNLLAQGSALITGAIYLAVVVTLLNHDFNQTSSILWAITSVYACATFVAGACLLRGRSPFSDAASAPKAGEMIGEFVRYCRPLALLALFSFAYDFADKWLLQHFSGAIEQGYFQIANQIASICLIATTAILSLLWKEIAVAYKNHDKAKVEYLYRRASRGLVFVGAFLCGVLLPWSDTIVAILLGTEYTQASGVLVLMLLYPIHQALGQIGGTTLLATGQTRTYLWVSAGMMLLSIPVSLALLAPGSGGPIAGLGLGATGLALKLVGLNILGTNLQSFAIARQNGWSFDWLYQPTIIALMIAFGFSSWWLSNWMIPATSTAIQGVLLKALLCVALHSAMTLIFLLKAPQLAGLDSLELTTFCQRIKDKYSWN